MEKLITNSSQDSSPDRLYDLYGEELKSFYCRLLEQQVEDVEWLSLFSWSLPSPLRVAVVGEYNHGNTPRMFIGAQNDLVNKIDEKARVDDLVIDRFMSRNAEVDFFRTSSKENCNIKEIFKELVIKILDKNKLDYDKVE